MTIINEHTSSATFMNHFPSLSVCGPFSQTISVCLTARDVPPPTIMGTQSGAQVTQCHCSGLSLSLRAQDRQGQALLGQTVIAAPGSALEPPERSHHKAGWWRARTPWMSSSPSKTLTIALSRCPDTTHKPVILLEESEWQWPSVYNA